MPCVRYTRYFLFKRFPLNTTGQSKPCASLRLPWLRMERAGMEQAHGDLATIRDPAAGRDFALSWCTSAGCRFFIEVVISLEERRGG